MTRNQRKRTSSLNRKFVPQVVTTLLTATVAPFFVWPVEFFLPYPYVIEEIVKAVFIYSLINISDKPSKLKLAAIIGILFSFSESVLYSPNFFLTGSFFQLLIRFFMTSLLHSLTMVLLMLSTFINPKLLIIGLFLTIMTHYFYNLIVLSIIL